MSMYDPLNVPNPFAGPNDGGDQNDPNAGWPSTPHVPNSPPLLRSAASAGIGPSSPLGQPPDTPQGKEPQIYGAPTPGLISPRNAPNTNGGTYEKNEPYLRVRITALDRNRRDLLIRLDAQTNLPNFTGQTYRNVSRSYVEFQRFYEQIVYSNPQTIIPALPLAQTSAPSDEEDDRLVKIMLQRWFSRICEDGFLLKDEELRSFIESDFGYQPVVRARRKTGSGFNLLSRRPPDEDEELSRARFELTKLEGQYFDAAKAVDRLSRARKTMYMAHGEMGNKLINVGTTEVHPPLSTALRKFGRTWHSLGDLNQAQAIAESVILGDSLAYQGMNARSAKETLLQRSLVLEEYQTAVKNSITKRRQIERLKASSNIRPERVDEALEDMEEATKFEEILHRRVEGISQNLHRALHTHSRLAHEDITSALVEHARSTIMYERQLLRELEALRPDFSSAANRLPPPKPIAPPPITAPSPPHPPKPHMVPAPSPAIKSATGSTFNGVPPSQIVAGPSAPPSPRPPPSANGSGQVVARDIVASQEPTSDRDPLAAPSASAGPLSAGPLATGPLGGNPLSAAPLSAPPMSTGPLSAPPMSTPPMGDPLASPHRTPYGTQSMYVTPASSIPPSPLAQSATFSPGNQQTTRVGPPPPGAIRQQTDGQGTWSPGRAAGAGFGPGRADAGFGTVARGSNLSQSMVQPTRSRLDAREAASKLANFF